MTERRVSLRFVKEIDDDIINYLDNFENISDCLKKAIRAGIFYFNCISNITPPTLPNQPYIPCTYQKPVKTQNKVNKQVVEVEEEEIDDSDEMMQNLIKTTNKF